MRYLFCLLAIILGVFVLSPAEAVQPNVTVDFNTVLKTRSPLDVGVDVSGYGSGTCGGTGCVPPTDATERVQFIALHPKNMRMALRWSQPGNYSSTVICGGFSCVGGGNTDPYGSCNNITAGTPTGEAYVSSIRQMNAEPIAQIPMYTACTIAQSANDAAALVDYFNNLTGITIKRWIVGNEYDNNGVSEATYRNYYVAMRDAMKAKDASIKVGGPGLAIGENTFRIDNLMQQADMCAKLDFLDIHDYGNPALTEAQNLTDENNYETRTAIYKNILVTRCGAARAAQIDFEYGEWNFSTVGGNPLDDSHFKTVWAVSAFGHMLRGGAWPMGFSDKALGFVFQSGQGGSFTCAFPPRPCTHDDPRPIYHAYSMYTGAGLFQPFGTKVVQVTTTLPNVEAFASTDFKSLVLVNESPTATQTADVQLNGGGLPASNMVTVWRKGSTVGSPHQPPVQLTTLTATNGAFSQSLPPYSVTTFVVSDHDNDGFSTQLENHVGTNPLKSCPTTGDAAWPPDVNNDTFVDISDVQALNNWFGSAVPPAPVRYDISPEPAGDNFVDISDLTRVLNFYGQQC